MENSISNTIETEKWDLDISPKHSLFDLHLKEVWNYRDLMMLMVRRDFVSGYTQTVLGPLWIFIQPIFTTIMFTFVFGNLAGISTNDIPGPVFYMAGLIPWNYFSDCLNKTSSVFTANAGIFGKVYFPRFIMPLTIVISNLVKLGIQVLLLIGLWLYFVFKGANIQPHYPLLVLFPFIILIMAVLGLGLGMIVSSITTKYRDLNTLIGFGVQLLMYATPIIYPLSEANVKYRYIINMNPLTPIMELNRYIFFGKGLVDINGIVYCLVFTTVTFLAGLILFNKTEKTFIDTV